MNRAIVWTLGVVWLVSVMASLYFSGSYTQKKGISGGELTPLNQSVSSAVVSSFHIVSNAALSSDSAAVKKPSLTLAINNNTSVDPGAEPDFEHSTSQADVKNGHYYESPEIQVTQYQEEVVVDSSNPTLIVYPDELVFEFPKELADPQNIKRAMVKLLLSEDPYSVQDWLGQAPVSLQKKPYFYKKILDQNQQPLRYPFSVYAYSDYLMQHAVIESRNGEGDYVLLHIPVIQRKVSEPVNKYHHLVANFSSQFKISPDLVFAIMEVESSFNPKAVSRSNAMGLMQLKAGTAGRDVYKYIDFKEGIPSQNELFDSENNIRMGTAYLSLLKHDYLSAVRNKENKELLTIASYNGGLSTVLGLFADTKEQAIEKINRLHPRQVYRTLRYQHESEETRRYLDKVLQAKDRYRQLLDDYV